MDHPNQGDDKALLAQDGENFVEKLESLFGVDGSLNFDNFQTWNFGNQSVAGGEQPAPGAPEFIYNENQTLSSHDKELNKQQCDQLIADTLKMAQPPTMPLGAPEAFYSVGQFGPPPAPRTQLLENQMSAGIQPLIQEQLDPAAEKALAKLLRKRAADREYRQREKEKKQKLTNRNQELENENQVQDQLLKVLTAQMEYKSQKEQQHLEKIAKAEAEIEHLRTENRLLDEKYEKASREKNQLRQKVVAMEKKICLFHKNLGKLCIEKPKKKLKEQVMMAETAEETENDN